MNALVLAGAAIFGVLAIFRKPISETVEEHMPSWKQFDPLFQKYGKQYDVPWTWLKAIALNESSLGAAKSVARGLANPNDIEGSKSSDGKSWGLMQVTITTAKALDPSATEAKLNNPEYSIKLAAQLMQQNARQFSKLDLRYREWVIKSYNQGAPNTKKEISGWRGPWSDHVQEYWERFKRNLERVEGNP